MHCAVDLFDATLVIKYANLKVVLVVADICVEESVRKSGWCYILCFSRLLSTVFFSTTLSTAL